MKIFFKKSSDCRREQLRIPAGKPWFLAAYFPSVRLLAGSLMVLALLLSSTDVFADTPVSPSRPNMDFPADGGQSKSVQDRYFTTQTVDEISEPLPATIRSQGDSDIRVHLQESIRTSEVSVNTGEGFRGDAFMLPVIPILFVAFIFVEAARRGQKRAMLICGSIIALFALSILFMSRSFRTVLFDNAEPYACKIQIDSRSFILPAFSHAKVLLNSGTRHLIIQDDESGKVIDNLDIVVTHEMAGMEVYNIGNCNRYHLDKANYKRPATVW